MVLRLCRGSSGSLRFHGRFGGFLPVLVIVWLFRWVSGWFGGFLVVLVFFWLFGPFSGCFDGFLAVSVTPDPLPPIVFICRPARVVFWVFW